MDQVPSATYRHYFLRFGCKVVDHPTGHYLHWTWLQRSRYSTRRAAWQEDSAHGNLFCFKDFSWEMYIHVNTLTSVAGIDLITQVHGNFMKSTSLKYSGAWQVSFLPSCVLFMIVIVSEVWRALLITNKFSGWVFSYYPSNISPLVQKIISPATHPRSHVCRSEIIWTVQWRGELWHSVKRRRLLKAYLWI